jgi:hypothetical protein
VRFNCEGGKLKSGSGNWRLSEKVGKEAGAAGGCWSDAHANTGDDLGKIWEGDSYGRLNFPAGTINLTAHGKA